MKKLLLIATVLAGGVAASQAGVNLHVSFGLPGLPLPGFPRVVATPIVTQNCAPSVTVAPSCDPVILEHRPVVIHERDYGRDRHYAFRQERWDHARDGHRR